MVPEGSTASASEPQRRLIESKPLEIGNDAESFLSPRFKSAAAMAGWDEEALLIASLVVDDTPEREFQQKKRSVLQYKSPPSGSRRKRRTLTSVISIPVTVLDLDDEEPTVKEDTPKQEPETGEAEPKKSDSMVEQKASASSLSSTTLPCMDKLREELSCAICLEICFEPSTTPCGHSFCKKCLRSAADKCGKKCPKCRQPISNGRSCTVNTVLWNTIQLLFPQEIEGRKQAKECSSNEKKIQDPEKAFYSSLQNHNTRATGTSSRHGSSSSSRRRGGEVTVRDEDGERDNRMTQRAASLIAESRVQSRMRRRSIRPMRTVTRDADVRSNRRGTPDQDQDAALALRLQREEFLAAFRDNTTQVQTRSSLSLTRAHLRAIASRAATNRSSSGYHNF